MPYSDYLLISPFLIQYPNRLLAHLLQSILLLFYRLIGPAISKQIRHD